MTQDILSDVLRSVHLRSARFFYVSASGAWAAEAPPAREIAGMVMPDSEHVMEYHVVTRGSCWAAMLGEPPVRLGRGDVIMFPQGDAHVVSSAPAMRGSVDMTGIVDPVQRLPFSIHFDAMEARVAIVADEQCDTTLVCGFLGCDARPFNPLLAALPRLLHVPARQQSEWVAHFVHQAAIESRSKRPGSDAMLERMSEMMLVDAVRRYVDTLPAATRGWLAGLRDRFVGRALALIHDAPAHPWTVTELGHRVGLSRSALHERFQELIGRGPMEYVAHWRMQVAARLLRETAATVASIALDVGYDSEAAFSRAFKRLVGTPPAAWRRSMTRGNEAVEGHDAPSERLPRYAPARHGNDLRRASAASIQDAVAAVD